MNDLPRIVRIIDVVPFKVTMLWSTNEIRVADFETLFSTEDLERDASLRYLREWEVFKMVMLSENNTLSWPTVPVSFSYKGVVRTEPLELDAQELYRGSTLVKKLEGMHVGAMLREARIKAGLSQSDVALKSGTSRHYISRIENDKSDIQLETFQKIVELGLGKSLMIAIE